MIGPMGGEVLWDNGLTLRVPEGAVTEEVSFSAVLHTTSAEADWVLLHVDLEPSDIWFDKPVVLSVAPSVLRRAPRDPSAIFVVSTLPDDAVAPDSSDAEVTEPEPVISTLTPEGDIQMELWHMSPKVVAECPLEPDAKNDLQKLKKLPKVRDVATGCTRALSAQIQAAYASYTGLLVSVEKSEPNLIVTDPLRGHLHPEVAEALEAAAKKTKSKIQLNYAFRALPVQYLLKPTCYDKCDAREDQDCTSCTTRGVLLPSGRQHVGVHVF